MLLILPYHLHYSLHADASVGLGPFRVLSDRVLFRVLSNRVLFRVLNDRVLFRGLLRVLSDSILCRVLTPRFLVCRLPSVASTTWEVLQWFSLLNISIATDVLILSLGNLMQLPEIWPSFWKEEKDFILDFWLGSEYPYAESFIFRRIHADGIPKDCFSERFFKISRKASLTEYFSKTL